MGTGHKKEIAFPGEDGVEVGLEGSRVFGELPLVDADLDDAGSSIFETGDERGVGDTVFLKADDLIGERDMFIEIAYEFSPSVGFGDAVSRLEIDFAHGGHGFWTASDGDDIGESVEIALSVDDLFSGGEKVFEANAGEEDGDTDFAGEELVGELRNFSVHRQGDFSHGRGNKGLTSESFDQSFHIIAATAFESGDTQTRKRWGEGGHWSMGSWIDGLAKDGNPVV